MKTRLLGRYAFLAAALILGIVIGCTPTPHPVTPKPVEVSGVTASDLDGEIRKQRGKVVLIEAWFLDCAPCRKKFHEFVELHRELEAEGLVCIALDVELSDYKRKGQVVEFLKEKGADTTNFIFNDQARNVDDWLDKHDCHYTPKYLAFNRQGEAVRPPEPADKENMTRFLKKLLAEK